MARENPDLAVAARLRAVKYALLFDTDQKLADFLGMHRQRVNNWLTSLVYPRVTEMIVLKQKTGITLDWIYAGDNSGLPEGMAARLAEHYVAPDEGNGMLER